MEVWRAAKGFEYVYIVSSYGNFKKIARYSNKLQTYIKLNEPKPVNTVLNKGYCRLPFSLNGKFKLLSAHRIVAETFLINAENKKQVNHKNGIKTDNRIDNLEWVSPKENIHHAWETGLINEFSKEKGANTKLTYNIANEIRFKFSNGELRPFELAKKYNVSKHTISCILNNKSWIDETYKRPFLYQLIERRKIIKKTL